MEQHQEGGGVTVSKDMEFLQQFEAVPLVELPVAIETKGETTAEGVCVRVRVCVCVKQGADRVFSIYDQLSQVAILALLTPINQEQFQKKVSAHKHALIHSNTHILDHNIVKT